MAAAHDPGRPTDGTEDPAVNGASDEETLIVAFPRHTGLPLDDCLSSERIRSGMSTWRRYGRNRASCVCSPRSTVSASSISQTSTNRPHAGFSSHRRRVAGVSKRFNMACAQPGSSIASPFQPSLDERPVERVNRTIKDATVRRFYSDSHQSLRTQATRD